jgi:uncharacterized SAM-binding protein YcdF (DUF218 family)
VDGSEPTLTDVGDPVAEQSAPESAPQTAPEAVAGAAPESPAEAAAESPAAASVARRRRWPKRVAIGLAVVLGLLLALYGVALYDVWSTSRHDEARPVDAIVVLGAAQYDGRPSPQLAARLDHALDLYHRGLAPHIFVTGGKQPLDRFTEAASEARYLQDRGVPVAALMREDEGRTSWQSLSAVADTLKGNGLHSVLLVSDPYHSARIKGMATELGLEAYVSPTRSSPVSGFSAFRHMLKEGAGVAAARVIGWDRLTSWTE